MKTPISTQKPYFEIGGHRRTIATTSEDAQIWFNRGLTWIFGFNHVEALRCFEQVIAHDPACAMGHWGCALALGPYINKPWAYFTAAELPDTLSRCHQHSQQALRYAASETTAAQALIAALSKRYPASDVASVETLEAWNAAYAQAMRQAYEAHPTDLDIASLFVEALMMRHPWKLWDVFTGEIMPASHTQEMIDVLDAAMRQIEMQQLPPHPGLMHMHIHTWEMSHTPEKSLVAADALRNLNPDVGHLLHMPGHIYGLCGHYYDAVEVSRQAVAADRKYLDAIGTFTEYTAACVHDLHLMMRAAMFLGQYQPTIEAANTIATILTDDVLSAAEGQYARTLESYYAVRVHADIRFGNWETVVATPVLETPALHTTTVPMQHYARAIAFAALGQPDNADRERKTFYDYIRQIPADYYFFNNYARDVFGVAAMMMEGEVEYHRGNYNAAFDYLREAVKCNDNLNYTEPWAWMHPPRHALGALLLAQDHVEEAESVYRFDLGFDPNGVRALKHPNNVWSLHGYAECLERLGKHTELAIIQPALQLALARTDVPITASCCCRDTRVTQKKGCCCA